MTIPNKVWPEALSEAAKMRREGVSDEDIGKGLAEFFTHLPRRNTKEYVCELCGNTGFLKEIKSVAGHVKGDPTKEVEIVFRKKYCRCSKGQAMRAGHQSGQSDDAAIKKLADKWGSR